MMNCIAKDVLPFQNVWGQSDPQAMIQDQVQAHNLDTWLHCPPIDLAQLHIKTLGTSPQIRTIKTPRASLQLDSTISLNILELPTKALPLISFSRIAFIFISVARCKLTLLSLVTSVISTHIVHSTNINLLFKQLLHKIQIIAFSSILEASLIWQLWKQASKHDCGNRRGLKRKQTSCGKPWG